MFPRGYFGKVGRFILWLLLLAGVIISLLQMLLRATDDGYDREDEVSYDERESALYMCNCRDCSSHVDAEFHAYTCDYRIWLARRSGNLGKE